MNHYHTFYRSPDFVDKQLCDFPEPSNVFAIIIIVDIYLPPEFLSIFFPIFKI